MAGLVGLRTCVSSTCASTCVRAHRFLVARSIRVADVSSPSRYSTVSTICSSVFGPAMSPPFVTWPTRNTGMPRVCLHTVTSALAHSRTCDTLPGEPDTSASVTV